MTQPTTLPKTPLAEWHRAHGARMADRGGWEMPVEYSSAAGEHAAVRARAGLFDLSHLGEVEVAGKDALAAVQAMTSNDAGRLRAGECQRSALTTPLGTVLDLVLVHRLGHDHFLLVVGAPSASKDVAWMTGEARAYADVAIVNTSSRYALVALEGPVAAEVLQATTGVDLHGLEPGTFAYGEVAGARATVARIGDTGEDAFEIFTPPQQAVKVWQALLHEGADAGVIPAGLDARDTLRLEAGVRLQGQDVDEATSVLEAGLDGLVGWDKGDFNGREALARQKAEGVARRSVGFEMEDGTVASAGDGVLVGGRAAGRVTSGAASPSLGRAIGLAYLPIDRTAPGTGFEVDVRGRRARARVAPLPFYTRSKG